ncbi:hypothetical protein ICE98_03800 [Lactococcus lactis]|nr:hypothetical protein [Lactococcus lactis]
MKKISANIKKFVGISLILLGTLTVLSACGSKESKKSEQSSSSSSIKNNESIQSSSSSSSTSSSNSSSSVRKDLEIVHKFLQVTILL